MHALRLAFRTLFRTPFVTGVAILSLALGIGANAAIFSLFEQTLLRPLPVHEADRLVNLAAPGPKPGSNSCGQPGDCDQVFSYPMFRDLETADLPLTGIAAHLPFGANVAFQGQTEETQATLVSGSYFPLLRLQPAAGRLFTPADDEHIGGHPVAVLSHGYWQGRMGSAPDVVGRTIVVNGETLEIIGVAPRGFEGTTLGIRPAVFVPITMRAQMTRGFTAFENRRSYWAYLFGRLEPGASLAQAEAALNTVYSRIINEVEVPLQTGMSDQGMAAFREKRLTLSNGRRGQSSVHEVARTPLTLLLATAGIVLLIACANIANLLLARGAGRSMEMAVRLSLGANRRQVVSQLLTESLVLAALGGLAGLLVANATLGFISSTLPPEVSATLEPRLDGTALLFTAAVAMLTGVLFGMFPALNSTRPELVSTIRTNAGNLTAGRAASRFRSVLVTSQVALAMALLVTAGLFLRSLDNVSRVELGLQPEGVVTFGVSPVRNGYDQDRTRVFFQRLEEELAALPGVTSVTASLVPLLSGSTWNNDVNVQGFERTPDTNANATYNEIGTSFFATLGIPIIAGRDFTAADHADNANVVMVNEAFTRRFGLDRDAVGRLMGFGNDMDREIVGVVADSKYAEVKDEIQPAVYIPYRQATRVGSMVFYVRGDVESASLLRAIPGVVAGLDPNLPVQQLKSMPQQVRENVFLDRMISTLAAAFATVATLLAAIGLYGVLAYTVAQRTREFGIRSALGASAGQLRGMVLRQVGVMLLIGGAIGVAAAVALGRAAASLLFGVEAVDPVVMAAAGLLLATLAVVAGLMPARRAAAVDPVTALRYD
ncbi:MAG TPA: ABC transporter permease [Longimicrobiales bacterium]|nr:ABC transporter permease [Longimicrobiales bacterium]